MITIDYFQDTDKIGTPGQTTLAEGATAEDLIRVLAEITSVPDMIAVDITGQGVSQVHMVRASKSGDWIYQSIGGGIQ